MVLHRKQPAPKTSLQEEYDKLDNDSKERVRQNIMTTCEMSETQFYRCLKDPLLVSKVDRHFIARIVFGLEVSQLFPRQ
jgi:hypothetical protein